MRAIRFALPVLLLLLALTPVLAQDAATVTLQPVAFVPVEGETFTTDVAVENTADLLGFQFDITFDPTAFAVDKIDLGPFLAATGRSAQPLGPDLREAATGRIGYGGFTLGSPEQAGAAGSGVLATITWRVLKSTDFNATLSRIQLAGPGGKPLPGSDTTAVSAAPQAPVAEATAAPVAIPTVVPGASPAQGGLALPLLVGGVFLVGVVAVFLLFSRNKSPRA